MPMYEFECKKGHVVEDLVEMGTAEIACRHCLQEGGVEDVTARRVLSPTRTNFRHADQGRGRPNIGPRMSRTKFFT
jgi:hypothetical protein